MTPQRLRCEYLDNPSGIDLTNPALSWILSSERRGERQTAYQVLLASSSELLAEDCGDLWDSGKVLSDQSIRAIYAGKSLVSRQRCHWKVRVWDRDEMASAWSSPATWEMGLLQPEDWKAKWIYRRGVTGNDTGVCPWFRKIFTIERIPEQARAYVSSIGYHELYINGNKVGDQVLAPSVSDLRKRALYLTHDITPYLRPGRNAVGIWLAPGWSEFRDANPEVDFGLKEKPLCIAQLHVDKTGAPLITDETWRCRPSHVRHLGRWQNKDFGGDSIDATRDVPEWSEVHCDDSSWEPAGVAQTNHILSPDRVEPNKLCEQIAATRADQVAPGKYRFAMAKLFTGWVEVKLRGAPGSKITIGVSSLPDRDFEHNQRNEYIPGASGEGIFRNRFSYHECGFVTIEGIDYEPDPNDVTGYRVTNDLQRAGGFDCSNKLLKTVYDVTVNTFVNLTTGGMTVDCPHRERLGYGGDGHTSMEVAVDAFSSHAFLSKWAQDWCDIQDEDGRINHTAPTIGGGGGPAWSGFVITMPWEVYLAYGDRRILESVYPSAVRLLEYLDRHTGVDGLLAPLPAGSWRYMDGGRWLFLGDWLLPGRSEQSDTSEALLFNNCYYLYITRLMSRIAGILGERDHRQTFLSRASNLAEAINRRFLKPEIPAYIDTKQTHCVMPLVAGAVLDSDVMAVERNLENEILIACNGHLDTGLHGTYFMTKYLTERQRSDLVFTYATQETYPGYGYFISRGFETWPEEWGECASRMHGCFNGIGGWFQRGLAGIRTSETKPGYKEILIHPSPVGDLTWVRGWRDSPYGRIVSNWRREGSIFTLELTIPANTSAILHLPALDAGTITESGRSASQQEGVQFLRMEDGAAVFHAASGSYVFASTLPPVKDR